MIRPIQFTFALLLVAVSGPMPGAVAAGRWETLRAINWVENPTNHTHFGPKGELGPYQFRRETWRMHTAKPFSAATDRAVADEVAVRHYEWLKRGLTDAGVEPSAFNIAMAWNCGLNAVVSGRAPTVSYRYAERVTNLVESMEARAVAVQATKPAGPARPGSYSLDAPAKDDAPRFVLVPGGPRFAVAGESPRFVLPERAPQFRLDTQLPRFALASE